MRCITRSVVQVVMRRMCVATYLSLCTLPVAADEIDITQPSISGVTVYDPKKLLETAIQKAAAQDLHGIADFIELKYRNDGYFAAEAVASLDPSSGRLVIFVHEGRLKAVEVAGSDVRMARLAHIYLDPLIDGEPLSIARTERQLLLLSDRAGLQISSQFHHRAEDDETNLSVSVDRDGSSGFMSFDTTPYRPDYALRLIGQQEFYGALKAGDLLRFLGVFTSEPEGTVGVAGQVLFRAPVGSSGTYFEAFGGTALSERDFQSFNLRSEQRGTQVGIAIGHPFYRQAGGYGFVVGEYEFLEGRSSTGSSRFRSSVHVVRAHLLAGRFSKHGVVLEASLGLTGGVREDPVPKTYADGKKTFAHVRAEVGLAVPILSSVSLRAEADGQLALSALPEVEHFFLGHLPVVRGYAQSEAEGDSGAAISLELTKSFAVNRNTRLSPFIFTDAGFVRHRGMREAFSRNDTLAAAGGGLEFAAKDSFSARAWIAFPFANGRFTEKNDPAIYLRLSKGW